MLPARASRRPRVPGNVHALPSKRPGRHAPRRGTAASWRSRPDPTILRPSGGSHHRDRGCRFPGLRSAVWPGHHIRHWAHGAPPRFEPRHARPPHRAVHRMSTRSTAPDGARFSQTGWPARARGPPPPRWPPSGEGAPSAARGGRLDLPPAPASRLDGRTPLRCWDRRLHPLRGRGHGPTSHQCRVIGDPGVRPAEIVGGPLLWLLHLTPSWGSARGGLQEARASRQVLLRQHSSVEPWHPGSWACQRRSRVDHKPHVVLLATVAHPADAWPRLSTGIGPNVAFASRPRDVGTEERTICAKPRFAGGGRGWARLNASTRSPSRPRLDPAADICSSTSGRFASSAGIGRS